MRLRVQVRDERPEKYTTKKGTVVNQQALHVMDASKEGGRFTTPIVYPLTDMERDKYSGKIRDMFLTLDIGDFEQFGKVFKCRDTSIVVGSIEGFVDTTKK